MTRDPVNGTSHSEMAASRLSSILREPGFVNRILQEPPFRLLAKAMIRNASLSIRTKAHWDAVPRPHYLTGVLAAADQAKDQGVDQISVIEFGVAGGAGLLQLQKIASQVQDETAVRISVFGFDSGGGLPDSTGDYRDHPDTWKHGDFPMDIALLSSKLEERTSLVLGNVCDTVPQFVQKPRPSIGFIAVDLDFYSSTMSALQILVLPGSSMLHRVPIYLDDVALMYNHKFAGELLAVDEFNAKNGGVKIDLWQGLANNRPFPESPWIKQMYVAHDLEAISKTSLRRDIRHLGLS
jgi:hypothetical protein